MLSLVLGPFIKFELKQQHKSGLMKDKLPTNHLLLING